MVGKDGDPAKAQSALGDLEVRLLRGIPGRGMLQVEVSPEEEVRGGGGGRSAGKSLERGAPMLRRRVKARYGEVGGLRVGTSR